MKKYPGGLEITKTEYREDAKRVIDMAKQLAPQVDKDTLIIGIDRKGRLPAVALWEALHAYTDVSSAHFVTYSSMKLFNVGEYQQHGINPDNKEEFDAFVRYLKRSIRIPKKVRNVIIIDEFAATGLTFDTMGKAMKRITGDKPVIKVSFTSRAGGSQKYDIGSTHAYALRSPIDLKRKKLFSIKGQKVIGDAAVPASKKQQLLYGEVRTALVGEIRRQIRQREKRRARYGILPRRGH